MAGSAQPFSCKGMSIGSGQRVSNGHASRPKLETRCGCHAGSFGFDFAATEWFHDATTDQYSVRVAVPDLPTELWNDLAIAIARWWLAHQA